MSAEIEIIIQWAIVITALIIAIIYVLRKTLNKKSADNKCAGCDLADKCHTRNQKKNCK